MARAERVKAWIKDFTAEGGKPRARLVVETDGAAAEYTIRLDKDNAVVLYFSTANREDAEWKAALLRAVGVRAEVKKIYHKSLSRDEWYTAVYTNALAADTVHEEVRKAAAEFLRLCREAGVLSADTYRRMAGKFERGLPEWGEVRFSVLLAKNGAVNAWCQPRNPESFRKAVEFLRGLGMRDTCEGEWCFVHFTAKEPRGGEKGFVRITVDGLKYIGWLASRGDKKAQWLRDMLLKEAEVKGEEVRRQLERRFSEWEQWGSVKPPFEKEVEVDGRRMGVRVEEVEAWREKGEKKEHLVVKIKAVVAEDGRGAAVEKKARFFKTNRGEVRGYVFIHASAEGGREADYQRTAAVLKALGVESWSRKPKQIQLTGGALAAFMRLEPVCAALGVCRKNRLTEVRRTRSEVETRVG
ncbi:PaRep2b protein [Pyrobaculum ferrireducens]|nr:PaRep2b protein [Pyrobaculum ferrireducens]